MNSMKLKSSQLGWLIVISTLTILMFILVAAIITFFITSQLSPAEAGGRSLLTNRSPLQVTKVDPALALLSLGGMAEAELIRQAVAKDRPEVALAGLLYQPQLSDRASAGGFLSLAPIYARAQEPNTALFCYELAGTITTLSPDIPNTARADLFIQIGEGLISLEEPVLAKFYLDQAFTIAAKSPFLKVVHRRAIFERLQKNYMILGQREAARTSLNLSANPPNIPFIADEGIILPQHEVILVPAVVQAAEAERWIKAQELAALLVSRGGRAPVAAQAALREALISEDLQKLPFYDREFEQEAQVSRQIDITIAKIEWLSLKYRVARQAYGLNIVPEWADRAEKIRADLTKSYETLFSLYADLIIALPRASQIEKATEERLRREILAGELGRYPNYPEEQRRRQLLEATAQLIETQSELNVFVGVGQVTGHQPRYTFISAEDVGGE
jgi:hypothetical protein